MDNLSKRIYLYPPDKEHAEQLKNENSTPEEKEPPRLELFRPLFYPCEMGSRHRVAAVSKGGASKGIAIEFIGDYLMNDDIIIENVVLEQGRGVNGTKDIPIAMEKRVYSDGMCILYWEDEDFPIPPGVDPKIDKNSFCRAELDLAFGICFTAKGNPRKALDIITAIIPIENAKREASAVWYAWKEHDSKESYIKNNNAKVMERIMNCGEEDKLDQKILRSLLLDPDDFDL